MVKVLLHTDNTGRQALRIREDGTFFPFAFTLCCMIEKYLEYCCDTDILYSLPWAVKVGWDLWAQFFCYTFSF